MSATDNGFTYKDGVSLKDYMEARLVAIEKATELAAGVLEARLESMNEFRADLRSQAAQFITRSEVGVLNERTTEEIQMLRDAKLIAEGKASQTAVIVTFLIAIIGLGIALVGLFINTIGRGPS